MEEKIIKTACLEFLIILQLVSVLRVVKISLPQAIDVRTNVLFYFKTLLCFVDQISSSASTL